MKKVDLIAKFAERYETTKKESKEVVELLIDIIKEGVIEDGFVDISGFLKIEKVHKEPRSCMNLQTGEKMMTKAKDAPKVKFSSKFKREIENGEIEE